MTLTLLGLVQLCLLSPLLDTAAISRFDVGVTARNSRIDGRVESMTLRGLVVLCPLTSSRDCCILSFGPSRGGHAPTRSGTVVPSHSLAITAVFPRSDSGGEGMTLGGLVLFCPLTLTLTILF